MEQNQLTADQWSITPDYYNNLIYPRSWLWVNTVYIKYHYHQEKKHSWTKDETYWLVNWSISESVCLVTVCKRRNHFLSVFWLLMRLMIKIHSVYLISSVYHWLLIIDYYYHVHEWSGRSSSSSSSLFWRKNEWTETSFSPPGGRKEGMEMEG